MLCYAIVLTNLGGIRFSHWLQVAPLGTTLHVRKLYTHKHKG